MPTVLPNEIVQAVVPAAMMQPQAHAHQLQQAQMTATPTETLVHHQQTAYSYPVYQQIDTSRALHPSTSGPAPQPWQATSGIAPQQTHIAPPSHMIPRHPHGYREDQTWPGGYHPQQPAQQPAIVNEVTAGYDYRYRDDQSWVPAPNQYYDQSVK